MLNKRIKEIRQHQTVNLSQEAFGKRLGVTGAGISRIESGVRNASEQIILAICREFNVNETWLRTGKGEMFIQKTRSDEISDFIGDVLSGEPDFRQRFISALSRMTMDEWKLLERKILEISGQTSNTLPAEPPLSYEQQARAKTEQFQNTKSAWEKEADEFAEIARQQYLAEKKRELGTLSVKKSGVG